MKKPFGKYINLKLNSKKLVVLSTFIIFFYVISSVRDQSQNQKFSSKEIQTKGIFLNEINELRLGKLFERLSFVEKTYFSNKKLAEKLGLISFDKIKEIKKRNLTTEPDLNENDYSRFSYEIKEYLRVDPIGKIKPSEKFIDYLKNKSEYFSFKRPRVEFNRETIKLNSKTKPVILMSANYKYFQPLKHSLMLIKKNFPQLEIIVYNMGFSKQMIKEISELCNCTLKTFDPDGLYEALSPHSANLNTYTWKPLIIQETLKDHETVIYIDTSIKFLTNEINHIVETVKDVGMLSRYIQLHVKCFTDDRMFQWFNESPESFDNIYTLEANLLIFHRNFVTSLIMKSWVGCALERDCIAPQGAHIYGGPSNWINGCSQTSCGCHRFDQDALSIVNTYFYGFPANFNAKPAFSLTNNENYFYELTRRTIPQYIRDQINAFLFVLFSI